MNCKISHDSFCFVCGKVNLGKVRTSVSSLAFIRRYQEKFDVDPRNRIVDWSPSMCCSTCMRRLADANRPMALVSPVQWNAPLNHPNDCYFCKSVINYGTRKNSRSFVKYATVTSVVPAVHEEDTFLMLTAMMREPSVVWKSFMKKSKQTMMNRQFCNRSMKLILTLWRLDHRTS